MTPYDDTIQHLELLASKVARLNELRLRAEEQLLHRIAADYRAGRITAPQILEIRNRLREHGTLLPGHRNRWNAAMPPELSAARLLHTARNIPNGDGYWHGEYPLPEGTRAPSDGINVVYVLYDARNVPCYVGSTGQFRTRIRTHHSQGKPFVRWLAYPCRDRAHAYQLEDQLLRECKPYLNRKAGR
mgnify:CR=1 FL=1